MTDFEPERWGADPKLVEVLGEQGADQFRALFDGFPEAVGVLWAVRDDDGRIVDCRVDDTARDPTREETTPCPAAALSLDSP